MISQMSSQFKRHLSEKLGALNLEIDFFRKKFQSTDFDLQFIINACAAPEFVVKGPNRLRKSKKVEFVLWIPFRECESYEAELKFVAEMLEQGITYVFSKYDVPIARIHDTIAAAVGDALAQPALFRPKKTIFI